MAAAPLKDLELIYLDIGALGRGEVVRLYLHACNLPFKDTRITLDAWSSGKKAEILKLGLNPSAKVPVLLVEGRPYSEHISILRYVARTLGLYGKDAELDYFADAVADSYQEWRNQWVAATFGSDEAQKKKYVEEELPAFLQRFETFLARYPDGPFVCGKDFSFADAALFQIVHNQEQTGGVRLRSDALPLLSKFYEAVQALPSLTSYLQSRSVTSAQSNATCSKRSSRDYEHDRWCDNDTPFLQKRNLVEFVNVSYCAQLDLSPFVYILIRSGQVRIWWFFNCEITPSQFCTVIVKLQRTVRLDFVMQGGPSADISRGHKTALQVPRS